MSDRLVSDSIIEVCSQIITTAVIKINFNHNVSFWGHSSAGVQQKVPGVTEPNPPPW